MTFDQAQEIIHAINLMEIGIAAVLAGTLAICFGLAAIVVWKYL